MSKQVRERKKGRGKRERKISKLMRDPVFTAIAIIDIKKKNNKIRCVNLKERRIRLKKYRYKYLQIYSIGNDF